MSHLLRKTTDVVWKESRKIVDSPSIFHYQERGPDDPVLFRKALSKAKLKVRAKKTGFLVQGDDRPGVVAEVLQKLADAKVIVTAVDGVSAGGGRYGAILWVKPENVNKAAKALQAV